MTARLLVIDDDEASRRLVRAIFRAEGLEVAGAENARAGLAAAAAERPHVVLLDMHLPDANGLDVLAELHEISPALPVIVVTADSEVTTAVRATQLGAVDYLTKPVDHDEIVVVVKRALEMQKLREELDELRLQIGDGGSLAAQMGASPAARAVIAQVQIVARSNLTALILGETGTGKEIVAQAIHRASDRRHAPFLAVDCGAIPDALLESELFGHERGAFTGATTKKKGHFQLAEGGTVLLDEIGNLPLNLQSKLLRVLESRQVQAVGAAQATAMDVRFLAATNDDLERQVASKKFRADLYFRLAQYTIRLPPLRERRADIPHLVTRFLDEARVELRRPVESFAPGALDLVVAHAWPGNVRELRNVVRQATLETTALVVPRDVVRRLLGEGSHESGAPAQPRPSTELGGRSLKEIADGAAREAERDAIVRALKQTRGNKSQAAKLLRTDYKTLHVKIKQLGIRARDFAP